MGGFVRLIHPFPSLLDGVVTAAIALVAGADPSTAGRLGASMVALQASIGTLNDLVDARTDAGSKPGKPIPAGLVSARAARGVAAVAVALGLILAGPSGPWLVALAVLGLAIGFAYDLVAKGTPGSWLPFALGIPLLPVFGWFGAVGRLPGAFMLLLPLAVAAGAALAIANAAADIEGDQAAGLASVATRLGPGRAWWAQAALLGAVVLVAVASLWLRAASGPGLLGAIVAGVVIVAGVGLGRASSAGRRQLAWEVEAIGLALLAAVWLVAYGDLG